MYVVYQKSVCGNNASENRYDFHYYNKLSNLLKAYPKAKKETNSFDSFDDGYYYEEIKFED